MCLNFKFLTPRDLYVYCQNIKGGLTKYRGYVGVTCIPSRRVVILNIVFSRFMLQTAFEKGQLYLLGIITCAVKGRLIAACFSLELGMEYGAMVSD